MKHRVFCKPGKVKKIGLKTDWKPYAQGFPMAIPKKIIGTLNKPQSKSKLS
jgi:hypothetical protein